MSFVYDRDGKRVAEAMDMRTEGQFLKMLARAGCNSPPWLRIDSLNAPQLERTGLELGRYWMGLR